MEVEEEFNISIPDDDIIYFRTLGNVHDYLLEKCVGLRRTDCPTRAAFYRLRRAMIAAVGVERRTIRPGTPLRTLLGNRRLHRTWRRLGRELRLNMPSLENRAGLGAAWGLITGAAGAFTVGLVLAHDLWTVFGAALMGLAPGVLVGYAVGLLLPPTIGRPYRTVGDLARGLVALNDREFRSEPKPATEGDPLWGRLCEVVVQQLGVKRETLHRETRFVEDLGF
jgi:acyl carrier protein